MLRYLLGAEEAVPKKVNSGHSQLSSFDRMPASNNKNNNVHNFDESKTKTRFAVKKQKQPFVEF